MIAAIIFAKKYWLQIAVAVLAVIVISTISYKWNKAMKYEKLYTALVAQNKAESDANKVVLERLRQQGIDATRSLLKSHQADLSKILTASKLKAGQYEKVITNSTLNNYRDSLRNSIGEQETASRLSSNEQGGIAEGDGDTALSRQLQAELSVCKEAGAVCAADYNFCHAYVKSEQNRIGVER